MQPTAHSTGTIDLAKLEGMLSLLRSDELREIERIVADASPIWVPLPGPQTDAYNSPADILYYGGSAGGGKSDLLLGLALTNHRHSIIFRRQSVQLIGIQARLLDEILRSRTGWNGQSDILQRPDGRRIEFGSCNNAGDEIKYQGRPHDLLGFDEIPHFLESQFRFLCGWMRSTIPGQRTRIVCAGNPPTDVDGRWVIKFWAPWLDPTHARPAQPGELRWYTTINGQDVEVEDGSPQVIDGRTVYPMSRTFIPSSISNNPFLLKTGYEATLMALPEPLRSQMLLGDFRAGVEDSAWQLYPTSWVDAAMARWTPDGKKGAMDSAGADIARGGRDLTVVSTRYGNWYDKLAFVPGSQTPTGSVAAGFIIQHLRDRAVAHIDACGVGGETVGHLESNGVQTMALVGYDTDSCIGQHDKATGKLRFVNRRALDHWRLREALDPVTGDNIALPPDDELKGDLCAVMWKLMPNGIQVEKKEDIKKRTGRGLHKGDAVVLASIKTPKISLINARKASHVADWNPFDAL